jgi:hypothetical protein
MLVLYEDRIEQSLVRPNIHICFSILGQDNHGKMDKTLQKYEVLSHPVVHDYLKLLQVEHLQHKVSLQEHTCKNNQLLSHQFSLSIVWHNHAYLFPNL